MCQDCKKDGSGMCRFSVSFMWWKLIDIWIYSWDNKPHEFWNT